MDGGDEGRILHRGARNGLLLDSPSVREGRLPKPHVHMPFVVACSTMATLSERWSASRYRHWSFTQVQSACNLRGTFGNNHSDWRTKRIHDPVPLSPHFCKAHGLSPGADRFNDDAVQRTAIGPLNADRDQKLTLLR